MNLTTPLHEMATNPDGSVNPEGLRRVQETVWSSLPESSRRNFFEFKGRQSCVKAAMAKPLPGASADAFIKGATKVAGETVHEVYPIHIVCLQAVDSPLLKLVQAAAVSEEKKGTQNFQEQDEWNVCYIFTENPKTLRAIIKNGGAAEIGKRAEELVDGKWNAAKINAVSLSVIEQFHRHIQTSVKFTAEVEGQGDEGFFLELSKSLPKLKE